MSEVKASRVWHALSNTNCYYFYRPADYREPDTTAEGPIQVLWGGKVVSLTTD